MRVGWQVVAAVLSGCATPSPALEELRGANYGPPSNGPSEDHSILLSQGVEGPPLSPDDDAWEPRLVRLRRRP